MTFPSHTQFSTLLDVLFIASLLRSKRTHLEFFVFAAAATQILYDVIPFSSVSIAFQVPFCRFISHEEAIWPLMTIEHSVSSYSRCLNTTRSSGMVGLSCYLYVRRVIDNAILWKPNTKTTTVHTRYRLFGLLSCSAFCSCLNGVERQVPSAYFSIADSMPFLWLFLCIWRPGKRATFTFFHSLFIEMNDGTS